MDLDDVRLELDQVFEEESPEVIVWKKMLAQNLKLINDNAIELSILKSQLDNYRRDEQIYKWKLESIKKYIKIPKEKCSICLEKCNSSTENVHVTLCGHVFHFDCINKHWEEASGPVKCPNCNQGITNPEYLEEQMKKIENKKCCSCGH